MEIPHLETRWDYRIRRENCLVNLYPHPSVLSRVKADGNHDTDDEMLLIDMFCKLFRLMLI